MCWHIRGARKVYKCLLDLSRRACNRGGGRLKRPQRSPCIDHVFFFLSKAGKITNRHLGDKSGQLHKLSKTQSHNPETSDFEPVAFSTSRRRPLCSASVFLLDMLALPSLRPWPSSLLFLSSLCFSFSRAAGFPLSSSLRFLFFRSSLARFSRSKPSAFLLARFSSSSLTTHGLPTISFRKAVFSAQAAASSLVVRITAVGTRDGVSPCREPRRLCRPTNPLQQHLPHLPERPNAPFDLDHRANVHPAQVDGATRSRHALTKGIRPARARRVVC